jgi:hypothetical protein
MWLVREFPTVRFERFADDAVVRCVTERQAHQVRAAIERRLGGVGLQLHPDETRMVYCKDDRRRLEYDQVTFTFCGYAFRPRKPTTGLASGLERVSARHWPQGS